MFFETEFYIVKMEKAVLTLENNSNNRERCKVSLSQIKIIRFLSNFSILEKIEYLTFNDAKRVNCNIL